MRIIKRKTNVREHDRQTKHKVADVRNHERHLKDKQVLAVIPLKNLNYKQSKAIFPRLNPNGDIDGDGVKNKRDCKPFDEDRQDDENYFLDDPRMEDEKEDAQDIIDSADYEEPKEKEEGGLFTTPQKELEESSWNILKGKKEKKSIW